MVDSIDGLEFSIVIPCKNEEATISVCVTKALTSLRRLGVSGEVIVADNNSVDNSAQIASALGARVVPVLEPGYGSALAGGIQAARGKFVIMGDADDSYDFSAIDGFVEKLREGNDLVMGCRLQSGGGTILPGAMPRLHQWGNPALSFICRLFFRSPVRDIYCGLRGFRKEAYLRFRPQLTGMEFAVEMIVNATLQHVKIAEIPITLYPDGRPGRSHLRTWSDGWRTLRLMLLYSPRWLFTVPGVVLFGFGLIAVVRLSAGPVLVGGVGFDVHTMMVAALSCIVGYQLLLFGVFTRFFAAVEGFLPYSSHILRLTSIATLERGVLTGLALFVTGMAMLGMSLWEWNQAGFGALDYASTSRRVLPSVLCTALGVQTIFSSFFLAILSLRKKNENIPPE